MGVEALRFFLALGVLVYHYALRRVRADGGGGTSLGDWGLYLQLCVQAFFVISGFVITESVARRSPSEFVASRLARLGPVLLVGSSLTLLGYAVFAPEAQVMNRYWNSVLVLPLMFAPGLDGALWSLRPELAFYTFMFLAALLLRKVEAQAFGLAALLLGMSAFVPREPGFTLAVLRFAPWFAVGLALHAVAGGRRAAWMLVLLALPLCAMEARYSLEAAAAGLRAPAPDRVQAQVAAVVVVAVVAASIFSVRLPAAWCAPCLRLGAASFPLYVIHQELGELMINRLAAWIPADLAVGLVSAAMVGLALFIAGAIEPPLSRAYRRALLHGLRRLSPRAS